MGTRAQKTEGQDTGFGAGTIGGVPLMEMKAGDIGGDIAMRSSKKPHKHPLESHSQDTVWLSYGVAAHIKETIGLYGGRHNKSCNALIISAVTNMTLAAKALTLCT